MEFRKTTKLNLINLSKKGSNLTVLIYHPGMTRCLLNFMHIKKTVKWISQTGQLLDLHSWSNFQDKCNVYNHPNFSCRFTYTKVDYIHLASSLPYMMIGHLLICPCEPLTNNQYWNF